LSLEVFGRHRGRTESFEPCAFARPEAACGDTRSTLVMKGPRFESGRRRAAVPLPQPDLVDDQTPDGMILVVAHARRDELDRAGSD
jgi:hypothetical protein